MFADNICVFCPSSVHGLQSILEMCVRLMQKNCMELFSTPAKLFL